MWIKKTILSLLVTLILTATFGLLLACTDPNSILTDGTTTTIVVTPGVTITAHFLPFSGDTSPLFDGRVTRIWARLFYWDEADETQVIFENFLTFNSQNSARIDFGTWDTTREVEVALYALAGELPLYTASYTGNFAALSSSNITIDFGPITQGYALETGTYASIYKTPSGDVYVTGSGGSGALGLGNYNAVNTFTLLPKKDEGEGALNWELINTSYTHTLFTTNSTSVYSTGNNESGQLGQGTISGTAENSPGQISSFFGLSKLSGGDNFSLAITSVSTLWAWGLDTGGRLGTGATAPQSSPVQVGTDTNWSNARAGFEHSLGLKNNGTIWAWGTNTVGSLGIGATTVSLTPSQVGSATTWVDIDADTHSVALQNDGSLWVWGNNWSGLLGLGYTDNVPLVDTPQKLGSARWLVISVSNTSNVGIQADGSLWAWGDNSSGQLGLGDTTLRNVPTRIGTDTDWVAISAGDSSALAMKRNGQIYGWGYKLLLGIGESSGNQLTPVLIDGASITIVPWVAPEISD